MKKFYSSIMAGAYIALGAIIYLVVPNHIVGTMFFASGIFLVINFSNMLFTRVVPLSAATGEYKAIDYLYAWGGNAIGGFFIALLVHFTRFQAKINEQLSAVVVPKLEDNFLSLFLMGVICAIFVTYAVLFYTKYPKGSFAQIFFVWLFITAFVFGGFDHIVANMFYLSAYSLSFGVQILPMLKIVVAVTLGNIAGGLLIGFLEKNHLAAKL